MDASTDSPALRDDTSFRAQVRRLVAMRFLYYFAIQTSYFIGIMGTVAFQMGGGVVALALSVGLLNVSIMGGSFLGGSLLDALGPRRHFAVAVASLALTSTLFQLIGDTMAQMCLATALFGVACGLGDAVARSYPAYLTDDPDRLKRVNALLGAASNVAVVAGPALGGLVASAFPSKAVFLLATASALLAIAPGIGFRPLRTPSAGANQNAAARAEKPRLVDAFRTTFSIPALNLLFWTAFLSSLGFGAFDPLESLFYRDVLLVGIEWMGWLSSAVGAGCILGSTLVLKLPRRHMNIRTLMVDLALMGVGCLVYVGTPYVGVALTGQVMLGVAFGALGPIQNTLVQTHAPLECLGRVNAVMGAGYNAAGTLPLFLAPALAAAFGVQGTLIGASCLVAGVPLACLALKRRRIAELVAEEHAKGMRP